MSILGVLLGDCDGGSITTSPVPADMLTFYYGQTADTTPTEAEILALTTASISSADHYDFEITPLSEGEYVALVLPNANTFTHLYSTAIPGHMIDSLEGYTLVENYMIINSIPLDLYYDGVIGSEADGSVLNLQAMFTRTS